MEVASVRPNDLEMTFLCNVKFSYIAKTAVTTSKWRTHEHTSASAQLFFETLHKFSLNVYKGIFSIMSMFHKAKRP